MTSRVLTSSAVLVVLGLAAGCASSQEPEPDSVALDDVAAQVADVTSYRVSSSTAQTLSSPLMGVDTSSEIDEERPAMEGEVSGDRSHLVVDLSTLMDPSGALDEEVGFEMWIDPERLTIDTTDYAAVAEADPAADLGPLRPGISYVDLASAGDEEQDQLLAALVGQGAPDLQEVTTGVAEALDDVERDGATITGTAPYAALMTATGTDVGQMARGLAGGLALSLGVDVDELTDLYVDFYEDTQADVTVQLDPEGRLRTLDYTAELSGIFARVLENPSIFSEQPPPGELEELAALADDTEWVVRVLQRYEIDEDLEVEPAPATDDDRTEEWVAFLEESGF